MALHSRVKGLWIPTSRPSPGLAQVRPLVGAESKQSACTCYNVLVQSWPQVGCGT